MAVIKELQEKRAANYKARILQRMVQVIASVAQLRQAIGDVDEMIRHPRKVSKRLRISILYSREPGKADQWLQLWMDNRGRWQVALTEDADGEMTPPQLYCYTAGSIKIHSRSLVETETVGSAVNQQMQHAQKIEDCIRLVLTAMGRSVDCAKTSIPTECCDHLMETLTAATIREKEPVLLSSLKELLKALEGLHLAEPKNETSHVPKNIQARLRAAERALEEEREHAEERRLAEKRRLAVGIKRLNRYFNTTPELLERIMKPRPRAQPSEINQ
jgi:RecA-family ATPase